MSAFLLLSLQFFHFRTHFDAYEYMNAAFSTNIGKIVMTLQEIKKLLGQAKKS